MKYFIALILSVLFINCRENKGESKSKIDYRKNSKLNAYFSFPDTVKVGERNLAIVTFYNPTFDSIVQPRIKDSLKYRYIIFNPLGVIICSKINGLDIGQDTEIQYLEVAKHTNINVKYSKKLF